MLQQLFGKNPQRMVEASEIRRTEEGQVVEAFTAFTLRVDRWFSDPEWKPLTRNEAQEWLDRR